MCYGRQFTLNKDPLPEYSSDVCPSEEHQIRQDEHGGGESREGGEAASFIRCRNISLLGNQQKKKKKNCTWMLENHTRALCSDLANETPRGADINNRGAILN